MLKIWRKFRRGKYLPVLLEMRRLLDSPDNWCQGVYWRDKNNKHQVYSEVNEESRFCLLGSFYYARNEQFKTNPFLYKDADGKFRPYHLHELIVKWGKAGDNPHVTTFNDSFHTKHEDVIEFLNWCIWYCGGEQPSSEKLA